MTQGWSVHFGAQNFSAAQNLVPCMLIHARPLLILYAKMKIKLTAPGIPRRSPIQVLTRPDPAWLPRSDEIGHVQGGMAVSEGNPQKFPLYS